MVAPAAVPFSTEIVRMFEAGSAVMVVSLSNCCAAAVERELVRRAAAAT